LRSARGTRAVAERLPAIQDDESRIDPRMPIAGGSVQRCGTPIGYATIPRPS
jgi:hypothetical protein